MIYEQATIYFECHVTIDPVMPGPRRDFLTDIAAGFNFKLAKLLMDKGEESPKDSFLTAHSTSFADIKHSCVSIVKELQMSGFVVRRYKIEDAVIDSRNSDAFELL